ncbi:MAG TPA: PTS sugar transporter subunit IIA [Leptospiraceae bacterium]|nr:PTS sugar transporter subunit IIA [Leptospiraceae bacterium]HMY66919.1 PTS sugar transporter subunit IIA [Leptospiraceae bacterium]HMZ58055.1 PTS sugar transporter subunit IIA [Leptospiraceae bacterium]HNF14151.1 PTS sugar transporter subunit IIA [Leptospiraceae bacterium]HNF24369.1 PTS sugar transporter subunit IIA [Leptospiraceae bacterium]
MNHLLELVTRSNIVYNLQAESKEEVIRKLVEHACSIRLVSSEKADEIVYLLLEREKSMSTGIGSGVAIPHCSITGMNELKVVIGLSKEGISFEAIDKLPVHIFIMLIVPKEKFQDHIRTLALIAKTLNIREEREKFIHCQCYEEIISAFSAENK